MHRIENTKPRTETLQNKRFYQIGTIGVELHFMNTD